MDVFIPIFIVMVVVVSTFVIFLFFSLKLKKGSFSSVSSKNESALMEKALKQIKKNPDNYEALCFAANVYYKKGAHDQALELYRRAANSPDIAKEKKEKEAEINKRISEIYLKKGIIDEAYKYIIVARSINPDDFESNYMFGYLEFMRRNYEKAVNILKQVCALHPAHIPAVRSLGHSYFRMGKNKEALHFIKQAIEMDPKDKESLKVLAECYMESFQNDQALRIYQHLRLDPVFGPESCLKSGIIHLSFGRNDEAIADFEIGLKHKSIPLNVELEIRYQLASAYINQNKIDKAMGELSQLDQKSPGYKDVVSLIAKYHEFCANRNMQIYAMESPTDFLALCRRIPAAYYPKARVNITKSIMEGGDWADIVADVDTPKMSETVIFRFVRTTEGIGEFVIRDFHTCIKSIKAGKGICMGIGVYSEGAKHFSQTRLIELVEKPRLLALFNLIEKKQAATSK
ncbi:MAG: tetratricopeptide repeat protein [Spirochaetaceae bacterium]|jgi:tetratricopeptide (TPR) repeat protein|nr:tetratricopeptide repeat protein [Spirochaetaceae bacterium]